MSEAFLSTQSSCANCVVLHLRALAPANGPWCSPVSATVLAPAAHNFLILFHCVGVLAAGHRVSA